MNDVPASLIAVAAGLVAVAIGLLVAGGLFWLSVRVVNAVTRRHPADPPAVPPVGYPKALAAATLTQLAQLLALAVVLAPAIAFGRVDVTVLSPALVVTLGLMWVASVVAAAVVARLLLPARTGASVAVGAVFMGVIYAVGGTLNSVF